MKQSLVTAFILLSCLGVQAEHSYTLLNPLNSGQDYHYVAADHITLGDGFRSEPQNGHEVILDIDAINFVPIASGIVGGSSINNTNGVVGSLGGVVDVSLLGGAVYSIPLDLPQGLGGIQPQLSIYYNSQERNGLLGWGWNMGGLSSISRTGSTIYHDGEIGVGNRFCLDGKRFMKTSTGSYGGNGVSYRTEEDQMSKIVSYTETGFTGPSYFKVWKADGNILYYGHTSDSKAFVDQSGVVNLWLLNRMEDRYGNTMEFHYTIEADAYRLDEIVYSGNANDNIPPAYRVLFSYDDRTDIDISYQGNCTYRKKYLLSGITVLNGDNEMYSYAFDYQAPNPQSGYYYHLLSQVILNADDEHLNPTKIKWRNNNYTAVSGTELKYHLTTQGDPEAFFNAVKFSGDFNGDGFDDVVAVRPYGNGQYEQARVFVNRGVSGNLVFDYVRSFNLSPDVSWIQVADLNGDGLDDIIIANRISPPFSFNDHVETEIYLSRMLPSGGLGFIRKYLPVCSIPDDMVEMHLIGDFLGEGRNSILIQAGTESSNQITSSLYFQYEESTGEFQMNVVSSNLNATRYFTGDFNGDGITEIMYKKSDGRTALTQLVQVGNTYRYNEVYKGGPCNWDDCFTGDYNGDGMMDMLFYTSNASQKWAIYLANQNGIGNAFPLHANFPYSSPGNYQFSLDHPHHTSQYIKTGDFDGNGCADVALYKNGMFQVFYGPVRQDGAAAPFANIQQISENAFNQYDNMELCLGNFLGQERLSFLGTTTVSRLPSTAQRLEVVRIIDGLGRKTEFAYDYLMPNPNTPSDDDFYHVNSLCADQAYHVYSKAIPLRALKTLTTYNVSNKPVTTACFYEGGLLQTQGKGFLGFSKTRQDDYCNGVMQKKTIRQYETNVTDDIVTMNLLEEEVYDPHGELMAKSTYHNRIYVHTDNHKVFIPISDKSIEEYDADHPGQLLKKEICETMVDNHCSQIGKYNGVLSVTGQLNGTTAHQDYNIANICEFQEIRTIGYSNDDLSAWLINRPSWTCSRIHREGDNEDVCHKKVFVYDSNKKHQVKYTLDIPNDGSQPDDPLVKRTDFQYDPVGNITVKTISTPNGDQASRSESYEYGKAYGRRFLTKRTDALHQVYGYSYHPVYGYCTAITDCNGLITEYEQDPLGVTLLTRHPDGTASCKALRWGPDSYYQWEKQTGRETKWSYFAPTGDALRTKYYDINGEMLISEFTYDDFGRIIKKWAPHRIGEMSGCIQYNYNVRNQLCRILHPDGSREEIEHDGHMSNTTYYALDGRTQNQSKTQNIMGWIVKSTDAEGNSVLYDYRADGKLVGSQIEDHNETRIGMAYDALGNQTLLDDPNYGTITYEYNAYNELIRQVSPKLDEVIFEYDPLGRMTARAESNKKANAREITEWVYGTEPGQRGLLTQINTSNQTVQYAYDEHLRLSEIIENIEGVAYRTSYTYDQASRVSGITYPSNYHVNYHYTSEGFLKCVADGDSNNLWNTKEVNSMMQPTRFTLGNGTETSLGYDEDTHRLVSILTKKDGYLIQNLSYEYDDFSNLIARSDSKSHDTEYFGYDVLNRLITVDGGEGHGEFVYDPLGRMTSKTNASGTVFSDADYSGDKPHAIKAVEAPRGVFPQQRMDLTYNAFDKVESITEGTNAVSIEYGYNHQRIIMDENLNGCVRRKTYVNSCEFITKPNGDRTVWTFVSGPMGVFAVAETMNDHTTLHYVHKDHLGSWTVVTDGDGRVEQENRFDAWGLCQNADQLLFDRGYTGHEHIKGMRLINMNGRLYDPVTSSMLSPDNNIQTPDFTQNFNRYAYCLNNPLMYTDPSGNSFYEAALIFYLMYCTDLGYEYQKYSKALAIHFDLHLSTQQLGLGVDVSFGIPKKYGVSYRTNLGVSYYWRFYDDSYSGFEFRLGGEWCAASCIGYSGTTFYQSTGKQTTNSIILGTYWCNFAYENDYMFNIGKYVPFVPAADNGDRYRSAAARFRLAVFSVGVNLFTGDPGVDHEDRRTFKDPDTEGRETYTISANGDNPDEYRAGVFYVGVGPFRIGANSEQVRDFFQNKFAHDFLCRGDSPYFKVLDRIGQTYFYFGTETGSTLW